MTLPLGDDPIRTAGEDLLHRERLAQALASEIKSIDASRGAVVAITGPWGSGKTSLMNLATERLRGDPDVLAAVEFNPWLFSGAAQLAENLLQELGRQLAQEPTAKDKLRQVVSRLDTYSRGFSALKAIPVVGQFVDAAGQAIQGANTLLQTDQTLETLRRDATEALAGLGQRVVVLVDDIDRLTRSETRDLFRTIRLSASFPNVVYVLCLDPNVVALSLTDEGFDGQAYLEKILTLTCRVPKMPDQHIASLFAETLNATLDDPSTPADEMMWAEAYPRIIHPLLRTMRDAKRILTSLPLAMRLLGGELPQVEIVVMEALRTLYPQLHEAIETHAGPLTEPHTSGQPDPAVTAAVLSFLAADTRFDGRLATALVEIIFTHARSRLDVSEPWYGQDPPSGSIGTRQRLDYYLSHDLPPGVAPSRVMTTVVSAIGDELALRAAFAGVSEDHLLEVLEEIWRLAPEIPPASVEHIIPVLLEQFPRLPKREAGFFSTEPRFAITRPALVLLKHLPPGEVMSLTERMVDTTPTAFAAFEIVTLVGHQINAGHKLVSEDQDEELKERLRQRIRAMTSSELAAEQGLILILFHTFPHEPGKPVLDIVLDPEVAAAVITSAVSTRRATTTGGRPQPLTVTHGLHWDVLIQLFGSEQELQRLAPGLRDHQPAAYDEEEFELAVDLLTQYLGGFRLPELF